MQKHSHRVGIVVCVGAIALGTGACNQKPPEDTAPTTPVISLRPKDKTGAAPTAVGGMQNHPAPTAAKTKQTKKSPVAKNPTPRQPAMARAQAILLRPRPVSSDQPPERLPPVPRLGSRRPASSRCRGCRDTEETRSRWTGHCRFPRPTCLKRLSRLDWRARPFQHRRRSPSKCESSPRCGYPES